MVTPVALVLQLMSGVFFVYTDLPELMQRIAAAFPLKWMCQGMRSVFPPESFAAQEAAGSWELGRVAMVLGAWCIGGLVLCLLTFRGPPNATADPPPEDVAPGRVAARAGNSPRGYASR